MYSHILAAYYMFIIISLPYSFVKRRIYSGFHTIDVFNCCMSFECLNNRANRKFRQIILLDSVCILL
jgi:hypothetical protein